MFPINLNVFKYVILFVLVGYGVYLYNRVNYLKSEKDRIEMINQENIRQLNEIKNSYALNQQALENQIKTEQARNKKISKILENIQNEEDSIAAPVLVYTLNSLRDNQD